MQHINKVLTFPLYTEENLGKENSLKLQLGHSRTTCEPTCDTKYQIFFCKTGSSTIYSCIHCVLVEGSSILYAVSTQ